MTKKTSNTDPIANALNIVPVIETGTSLVEYFEANTVFESIKNDFEFSKANIKNILMTGEDALGELVQLARQSAHPRSYEVLAGFIKTLSETNKDLLTLHKQFKELTVEQAAKSVTNNLFVGTPAELLKMIKQNQEEENSDGIR